jgi:hypothetical protein
MRKRPGHRETAARAVSAMSVRAPLVTGTALSLAAVSAWSWMASLTIGPAAPLHLTRDLPSDYAQLASAPTGNGAELFAVVAFIFAACLLASGRRRYRRAGGADG